MRDAGPVVEPLLARRREDDAPFFDLGERDPEQVEHRGRRHLAREHLPEEFDAAHAAAGFDVCVHLDGIEAACSSRSTRYRILPTALIGSVSRMSTWRGILYSVRCSRQNAMMSSGVAAAPGFSATHAFTVSPWYESGMPITAASRTAGCEYSTASTSDGYTL